MIGSESQLPELVERAVRDRECGIEVLRERPEEQDFLTQANLLAHHERATIRA
jgi:hypothetical protein